MKFVRAIVLCSFFILFEMRCQKVMAILYPRDFPAVYNFGDSNSDTGGMAAAFSPPVTFKANALFKQPSGRSCDGRLLIDFIADTFGYPYLSAYLDSIGTNFNRGANFAISDAVAHRVDDSYYERGVSPFPLDIQVQQFAQFKNRSAYFYELGQDQSRLPLPWEFAKALYIIDIGQNDIAYGFAANQSDQEIIALFPNIMNQIALAIKKLYELGARKFWIFNTGPIGCLPISVKFVQDTPNDFFDPQGCIKYQNDVALEFNKQLWNKVLESRAQLNESELTYVDIYTAKYGLISNATNLGFHDPFEICCGYYVNKKLIPCGTNTIMNGNESFFYCDKPSKIISWDGVHYSEAANSYVANQIFTNFSLSNPPISN